LLSGREPLTVSAAVTDEAVVSGLTSVLEQVVASDLGWTSKKAFLLLWPSEIQ
jgi:hypothetical protein